MLTEGLSLFWEYLLLMRFNTFSHNIGARYCVV